MKRIEFPAREQWAALLQRPASTYDEIESTVREVFKRVQAEGDQALRHFTGIFDGVDIEELRVPAEELSAAGGKLSEDLKEAIQLAKKNIERFHASQRETARPVETMDGVMCWQEKRPIERVGFYIPGGSAPLFSTVLMLAVPAAIAGCREVCICTPPAKDGKIHPAILYTAQLCGVEKVYRVGGIQAIAALTFGAQSIEKVYKIYGPGNQFVTAAKQMATRYGVAIDMPAGPSELLIYADNSAIPEFVAADLLSQAEHGPDSQVVFITTSSELLEAVSGQLQAQLEELPRKEIARKAMENSRFILVADTQTALDMINAYGPEHLILCSTEEERLLAGLQNAGSVFIGNYSPESAGDYASGTNHTLPTNGYTRQYSGLNLDSFTKAISFQKISEKGILNLGPAVELMAAAEGLEAHRNAVTLRLQSLTSS